MSDNTKTKGWRNWSGNQTAPYARVFQPCSESELRDIVLNAEGPIRIVGAGHSFTPIVSTSGTIINLDKMGGIVSTDLQASTATLRVGGRVKGTIKRPQPSRLSFLDLLH